MRDEVLNQEKEAQRHRERKETESDGVTQVLKDDVHDRAWMFCRKKDKKEKAEANVGSSSF